MLICLAVILALASCSLIEAHMINMHRLGIHDYLPRGKPSCPSNARTMAVNAAITLLVNKCKVTQADMISTGSSLFRGAFQELVLVALYGFLVVTVDFFVSNSDVSAGAIHTIRAPVAFLFVMTVLRVFELEILAVISNLVNVPLELTSIPFRLGQKLIIMTICSLLQFYPEYAMADIYAVGEPEPATDPVKDHPFHAVFLHYGTKLVASFAVVNFARLHMEIGIVAWKQLHSSVNAFFTQSEPEEYKEKDENGNYIIDPTPTTPPPPVKGKKSVRFRSQNSFSTTYPQDFFSSSDCCS